MPACADLTDAERCTAESRIRPGIRCRNRRGADVDKCHWHIADAHGQYTEADQIDPRIAARMRAVLEDA